MRTPAVVRWLGPLSGALSVLWTIASPILADPSKEPARRLPRLYEIDQVHRVTSADSSLHGLRIAYGPARRSGPVFRLPAVRLTRAGVRLADGSVVRLETPQGEIDSVALGRADAREIQVIISDAEIDVAVTRRLQVALLGTDLESATLVEPADVPWVVRLAPTPRRAPGEGPAHVATYWSVAWSEVAVPRHRSHAERFATLPIDAHMREWLRLGRGLPLRLDIQIAYEASYPPDNISARSGSIRLVPWRLVVPCVPPAVGREWIADWVREADASAWLQRAVEPDWAHEALVTPVLRGVVHDVRPSEAGSDVTMLRILVSERFGAEMTVDELVAWPTLPIPGRLAEIRQALEPPADGYKAERFFARRDVRTLVPHHERDRFSRDADTCLVRAARAITSASSATWASLMWRDWVDLQRLPDDFTTGAEPITTARAVAWIPLTGKVSVSTDR